MTAVPHVREAGWGQEQLCPFWPVAFATFWSQEGWPALQELTRSAPAHPPDSGLAEETAGILLSKAP